VDVVIGDYLYSFQFKLEDGGEDDEPQPLDMDSFWDEQHDEHMEEGRENRPLYSISWEIKQRCSWSF
jgi:hypothetical protein